MSNYAVRYVTYFSGYSKLFFRATWHYRVPGRTRGFDPEEHPAVWADRKLAAKPLPMEKGELVTVIAQVVQDGPKTSTQIAAKIGARKAAIDAALTRNKALFRVTGQTPNGLIWRLNEKKGAAYCFGNPDMVRNPRAGDWTQTDEERLRSMANDGLSIEQIADELGRSALAVERRGKRLGVWQKRNDFWLDAEIAQLRELAQTHTYEQAAAVMGRTVSSVSAKAKRLRISFLKTGEANSSTVYGSADIQRVFELRAKAMTLKEIAAETGMHFSHVSDILNYAVRYREALNISES